MTDEVEQDQQDDAQPPKPIAYIRTSDVDLLQVSGHDQRVTLYGPKTDAYSRGEEGDPSWRPVYTLPFA